MPNKQGAPGYPNPFQQRTEHADKPMAFQLDSQTTVIWTEKKKKDLKDLKYQPNSTATLSNTAVFLLTLLITSESMADEKMLQKE